MVHIDAETLRRHPVLGVLIGGAGAIFMGCLIVWGVPEARALLGQRAPDPVSLHETVSLQGARWVTVSEGQWHCDRAVTIERSPGFERWLWGPIETVEVPITGATEGDVLVASFDGPVTCDERAGSSLTGVVGSTEIFGSRAALRRWRETGDRVAILEVGASPRTALLLLLALIGIAVIGLAFAGYYLRLMLQSGARKLDRLPATDPIQPS